MSNKQKHQQGKADAAPVAKVAVPLGAWWNGIARKWFTSDGSGEPVALDPQPDPPPSPPNQVTAQGSVDSGRRYGAAVPPAVKVMA